MLFRSGELYHWKAFELREADARLVLVGCGPLFRNIGSGPARTARAQLWFASIYGKVPGPPWAPLKDGGWVYTEQHPGVQNGNSGWYGRVISRIHALCIPSHRRPRWNCDT